MVSYKPSQDWPQRQTTYFWKISSGHVCPGAAGSWSLLWLKYSTRDNLAIWYHLNIHMIGLRGRLPIGLKIKTAMASAEINAEMVCPLWTLNFATRPHDYGYKNTSLKGWPIAWSRDKKTRLFSIDIVKHMESQDEVYTDGSKINARVGAGAVINRHFQNGETNTRQLSKRLPENSTIFTAEDTAISLALN